MPLSVETLKTILGYDPSDNTSFEDGTGIDYGRMMEALQNNDAARHISNSTLGRFIDIADESIRDFTFIKEESEKEIERRKIEMREAEEAARKAEYEEAVRKAAEELVAAKKAEEEEKKRAAKEAASKKRAATRAAKAAAPVATPTPPSTPAAPSVDDDSLLLAGVVVAPVAVPVVVAPVVETLPTYATYQKIDQVAARLTNHKQIDILHRVRLRHPDDQMYFISFERNVSTDPKKRSLMGTFLVLGTLNKHGERSQYHIDMYDPTLIDAEKKSFYCNCPAHKFQGARDNTVCKHISFVMCRVVGYMTEEFFKTHRLTKAETDMVVEKVSVRREVLMMHIEANRAKDAAAMLDTGASATVAYDPSKWITRDSFKNSTRDMAEEACPICFDDIVDGDGRLNCPECKKHIHKDCIEVWLSRHDSCVYCRSTKWKHYRKCFIENGKVAL
jgi:Ring finger domain